MIDTTPEGWKIRSAPVKDIKALLEIPQPDRWGVDCPYEFLESKYVCGAYDSGGNPQIVWGVKPLAAVSLTAWVWVKAKDPWLARKTLVKIAPTYMEWVLKNKYPILQASILRGAESSERFIKYLGFSLDKNEPVEYNGKKYLIYKRFL